MSKGASIEALPVKGKFRCPQCKGIVYVHGKRAYRVHPNSGAMLKDGMPEFDVVCERAHVLAEGVTNPHRALKQVVVPEESFLDSPTFEAALEAVTLGHRGAVEHLKHLIRDRLWSASVWDAEVGN
jgi:hypothetical protein